MTETSPTDFNWINYIYTDDITAITPVKHREGNLEWVEQERLDSIPKPTTDRFIYDYLSRSEFFVFDAVYDENLQLVKLVDELSGKNTIFKESGYIKPLDQTLQFQPILHRVH